MKRVWFAAILLGFLSLVLFGAALFLDRALIFRDIVHYYWPTRVTAEAGSLVPQWAASPFAGLPLLADAHAGVLYPMNQLSRLAPFHRFYAWSLTLHYLAAGLGVFVFLRRIAGGPWAAGAAALAFMGSGYLVGLSSAGPLMSGLAYLPWVLVVLSGTAPRERQAGMIALLCTLQALSGDPQSVLYTALVALAWTLWQPSRRGPLLTLSVGLSIAALLASVQLLPAWQLLQASTRMSAAGEGLAPWTLSPLRLMELFLPFPYGGYLEVPRFWAGFSVSGPARIPFALSVYLGASTLVLGVLGLQRSRACGFALTLIVLGLLLALGGHVGLGALHMHVPPFRFFRYPEKYVLLATLGWAVLVGLGLMRVLHRAPLPRRRLMATGVLLALVGGLGLGLWALREQALGPAASLIQATGARAAASQPVDAARNALGLAFAFGALALGALLLVRRRPGEPLPVALLLAVIAADLVGAGQRVVWLGGTELFTQRPALVDELERRAPVRPYRLWRDNEALKALVPGSRDVPEFYQSRLWELATLKSNLPASFGLEELSGYGAVQLQRQAALADALATQPARLAQLLNGCFLITSANATAFARDARLQRVLSAPELKISVWQLRRCLPRLRTVEQVTAASSQQEAVRRLSADTFDPEVEAIVEGERSARLAPAVLENVQHAPGWARAKARVPPGGGFALLANSAYPGWEARINGLPAPTVHANLATLGLWLPEGEHEVEFRFRERGLALGSALSLLGLLAVLALLWWSTRSSTQLERGAQ